MTMKGTLDENQYKACCTSFYESDLVCGLLGEDFHPGGRELTLHIGEALRLTADSVVLDVACGTGASAVRLTEAFGCRVTGVDLSEKNLKKARARAKQAGLADRTRFLVGDAEKLPLPAQSFDAVISECSICTLTGPETAAAEMARVVRPGGRLGVSDVVVDGEVPQDLQDVIYRFACVAGARSVGGYQDLFEGAGFTEVCYEDHTYTLEGMLGRLRRLLRTWRSLESFLEIDSASAIGLTTEQVGVGLDRAASELAAGRFKYGVFLGRLEDGLKK